MVTIQKKTEAELLRQYQDCVLNANRKMLKKLSFLCALLLGMICLYSLLQVSSCSLELKWGYGIGFLLFTLFYFICGKWPVSYHGVLKSLYIMATVICGFTIYLSVCETPSSMAAGAIGFFCLASICIIDDTWRVSTYIGVLVLIHILFSYFFKESRITFNDIINFVLFGIIGVYLGYLFQKRTLNGFEAIAIAEEERNVDFLTGLYNRRKFDEVLENSNDITGLLMLDVDNFKRYNDHYGHVKGDTCLRQIGMCLKLLEEVDKVQFFRYGGEELIGICHQEYNSMDKVARIAEKVRVEIAEKLCIPFPIADSLVVTVSIGYVFHPGYTSYERLVKEVDMAMYRAKTTGKNRVVGYQI